MKLEQQVVSLELAQKLKEIGVEQDSLFIWIETSENKFELASKKEMKGNLISPFWSAFTVAELDKLIGYHTGPNAEAYGCIGHDEGAICYVLKPIIRSKGLRVKDTGYEALVIPSANLMSDNPADARGKLMIYLSQNVPVDKALAPLAPEGS